jgi:hypothetical protein
VKLSEERTTADRYIVRGPLVSFLREEAWVVIGLF